MSDTVKFGYGAASNITFHGTYDTGIEREDWDEMSNDERESVETQALYDLVELWVEGE